MTEIRSYTLASCKPGFHVSVVRPLGVSDREQEAFATVEKPEPHDVRPQKRPHAMGYSAGERNPPRRGEHLGAGRRVAVHPAKGVFKPQDRMMIEGARKTADRSLANDALVNEIVAEARLFAAEQA